jgi:hypothetical protein
MTEPKKLSAIEKLDAKIEAMRQQRAVLVSRETNEQRKLRGRKCAILGAWLMANDPDTVAKIISQLKRPQDVAVFVDSLPEKPSVSAPDIAPGEK